MKFNFDKLLIALFVGVGLVACAKKQQSQVNSAFELSAQPRGMFTQQGQAATENNQRFDVGCETKGRPQSKPKIDERLSPRAAFRFTETESFEQSKRVVRRVEYVDDVSASGLYVSGKITILNGAGALAGAGVGGAQNYRRICLNEAAEGSEERVRCESRPMMPQSAERYCNVGDTGNSDWQTTVVAGTYKIGSSRSVQGYKITRTGTASVVCGPELRPVGTGKMVWVEIVSNEVPSVNESFCGGVPIFSHIKVIRSGDSRENLIYNSRFELESADWRRN